MWCRHCQQETPAAGPNTAHGPRCARCHRTSPQAAATPGTTLSEGQTEGAAGESDTRREIYRKLRAAQATLSAGEPARTLRFDLGQTGVATRHGGSDPQPPRGPVTPHRSSPPRHGAASASGQTLAWMTAAAGSTVLGLGIGLLAWSLLGDRPGLWNPGLAAAIGGQGLVIVGLLQLLTSLWSAGRQAARQLDQMHAEIRRVRRVQEETAGRHAASAATFYSELARDAGPDLLLGNLQGQVDRLASRLRAE